MTQNVITVDAIVTNKYKNKTPQQDNKYNLYLFIIQQLKLGFRPAKIAQQLGISKQTLQHDLTTLKEAGVIQKIGYGVWEVSDTIILPKKRSTKTPRVGDLKTPSFHQTNLYLFEVRAHAFVLTLQLPETLENWNNTKREKFLEKQNINYLSLKIYGGGQRIIFKGHKIWLTDKSVIVYDKASYLAKEAKAAKSKVIYHFLSVIKSLERALHADFTQNAGRHYRFKVSRQHYALINNALAKQYNEAGEKLTVHNEKGLWFLIDNSLNLNEAETVHPETADSDSKKIQDFFNSLKSHPITSTFVLEAMNGIQANQLAFAENTESHIEAVQELGTGVKEWNNRVGIMNELLLRLIKIME